MSDPLTDPAMEPRGDPPNDRCCAGTAPEHVLRRAVWRDAEMGGYIGPHGEKAGRRAVGAEWRRPTNEEWRVATDYWTRPGVAPDGALVTPSLDEGGFGAVVPLWAAPEANVSQRRCIITSVSTTATDAGGRSRRARPL